MHECKTVTLRTRPLKGRMLSFYLDYYSGYRDKETMKVIRHESLGIYLYADSKNKREQNFNEVMAEKAESIHCRSFESVVNSATTSSTSSSSSLIFWRIFAVSAVNMPPNMANFKNGPKE